MIESEEELSPAGVLAQIRNRQAVAPTMLPVLPDTWLTLKGMNVVTDEGRRAWLQDGTHVWRSFRLHWGWWKTQICGWYPYTSERDYYLHERSGEGRPWLNLLPERWQEIIFRELVLLIDAWNKVVAEEHQYRFEIAEPEPAWMSHWLALTNEAYRRGGEDFLRDIAEHAADAEEAVNSMYDLQAQYFDSLTTWRPMMPDYALHHRKYGARAEYWSFERNEQ